MGHAYSDLLDPTQKHALASSEKIVNGVKSSTGPAKGRLASRLDTFEAVKMSVTGSCVTKAAKRYMRMHAHLKAAISHVSSTAHGSAFSTSSKRVSSPALPATALEVSSPLTGLAMSLAEAFVVDILV
ncbi:hypothetical protein E4U42_000372 [Claviceps africana]|uniref:Uncharacterized protein n=1 Tax=Claviceps africana TaxID=83212 RepID=A0A8K0NFK5_9HYPO|nr:hypothetical protein E4U42_000372 [Claviceps africana]